ncbi:MAG: carboxymuconolactone decarboxylase family protein [Pseudomonadota bacterium]
MSNPINPFSAMLEQMQSLARTMPGLAAFDPKAIEAMWPTMPKDMMEAMFGNAINEGGLDAKTRLLLTIAGMVMQGAQNEIGLRSAIRHAAEAGATDQEISEAIGQMAAFAGLPASTRGLEIAGDVLKKDDEA